MARNKPPATLTKGELISMALPLTLSLSLYKDGHGRPASNQCVLEGKSLAPIGYPWELLPVWV